jgi:uncharacterized lipoprotein YddW (UPF0748 family)
MPSRRTVLSAAAGGLAAAAVSGSSAQAGPGARHREPDPYRPKHQFRGLWIATVVNLNWPSKAGLTAEQQQAELIDWFDLAVRRGYNAIVLQVRSAAQVFYESELEPWSAYLTGTQGRHPGYDPLEFAVEQAHRRGLELHAWFNPYQMVRAGQTHNTAPNHPSVVHPEWGVEYGGTTYFNPGLPEARRWVEEAIMLAVEKYDIDAVHFDDFFYPYPVAGEVFDDQQAHQQYGNGMELGDWRRQNVNLLISELGTLIKKAKPWVKWGISPFAIWRNASTDPEGSATNGLQSYDAIYADTREWVRQQWIDYICPQVYWSQDFAVAPYDTVVDWWCEQVAGTDVALYIGEAAYKIGAATPPGWSDPEEMSRHLAHCASRPEVQGNIYFSIPYVRDDALGGMTRMERTWYSRPALVPPMPWIDDRPPHKPEELRVKVVHRRAELTVRRGSDGTVRYAIYRIPRRGLVEGGPSTGSGHSSAGRVPIDATHLAAVRPAGHRGGLQWTDPEPYAPGTTYLVTALDRTWNESRPVRATGR